MDGKPRITREDIVGRITEAAYGGRSIWADIRAVAAEQHAGPLPVKLDGTRRTLRHWEKQREAVATARSRRHWPITSFELRHLSRAIRVGRERLRDLGPEDVAPDVRGIQLAFLRERIKQEDV